MKNQRHDYRHAFTLGEGCRVEMMPERGSGTTLRGEIADLSVSGAGVRLDAAAALPPLHARLRVRFVLGTDQPIALPAEVVHGAGLGAKVCGMRFLPMADLAATEARGKLVWKYLLQEQRRQREVKLRTLRGK